MSIDKFLLDQGPEVFSQYQTEDLSQEVSLIGRLMFEDSESPYETQFKVDVSEIREMFPVISEFRLEDQQKLIPDSTTKGTKSKQCGCGKELGILRREYLDLQMRYRKLCLQNIQVKEKLDTRLSIAGIQQDKINTMLSQQLTRVLDENKILSLDNESLRKQVDNKLKQETKTTAGMCSTRQSRENKQPSGNRDDDLDRIVKYYTKSISELLKENIELKEEVKQISAILTNQLIKVNKLESRLEEERGFNFGSRRTVGRADCASESGRKGSSRELGSLSRVREMLDLKSGVKTPHTNSRQSPISEFNLEQMLKINS